MKKFTLIYLILCGIYFWTLYKVPSSLHTLNDLLLLGFMTKSYFDVKNWKNLRFKKLIIFYFVGLLLNSLSALINYGQNPLTTLWYARLHYFIFFYFYLHLNKHNIKELETTIIVLGVIYCFLYLYVKQKFPYPIITTKAFIDRGTLRVKFPGNGFHMLGYFLLLNRFFLQRKLWQIGLVLFFFGILFLAGYRSLAAVAVFLSAIMYFRLVNYSPMNYLILIPLVLIFVGLLQVGDNAMILQEMITASEDQQEQGEDYIRFITMNYYRYEYPKNFLYYVVGGGIPAGFGRYAQEMNKLQGVYGIYWVDLGLIGYYWVFGLVAALGLVGWGLKVIFSRLPPDKIYLKFYFAYLIMVSFTTKEIFNKGMLIVQAIALFIADMALDERKRRLQEKTEEQTEALEIESGIQEKV